MKEIFSRIIKSTSVELRSFYQEFKTISAIVDFKKKKSTSISDKTIKSIIANFF